MKKIGIIGCGMIAELAHCEAIQATDGLQLMALYDNNFDRALKLQKKFNVPHCYPNEDDFYKSDLDAIVICTPAPVHFHNIEKAVQYNKHVLCEKPLGMDIQEIEQEMKIMDEAGLLFFAGFNYRFSKCSQEIKRLVSEKAIGKVRAMRLTYIWNLHGKFITTVNGTRRESDLRKGRMEEGGPMVDCGLHQIDLARWWCQSEVLWQKAVGIWVEQYEYPDHMHLQMRLSNGCHVMIEISFSYSATSTDPISQFTYELIGSDGIINYSRELKIFELRNSKGRFPMQWYPEKDFKGMYREFAKSLEKGVIGDMPTPADALVSTYIAKKATNEALQDREKFLNDIYEAEEEEMVRRYMKYNISPIKKIDTSRLPK